MASNCRKESNIAIVIHKLYDIACVCRTQQKAADVLGCAIGTINKYINHFTKGVGEWSISTDNHFEMSYGEEVSIKGMVNDVIVVDETAYASIIGDRDINAPRPVSEPIETVSSLLDKLHEDPVEEPKTPIYEAPIMSNKATAQEFPMKKSLEDLIEEYKECKFQLEVIKSKLKEYEIPFKELLEVARDLGW